MTRLSVYCASSTDGYIATLDDRLDWLDAAVGEGRPLFHPVARTAQLRLDDVRAFPSGMLNLYYSRVDD